jgi:hypothetical protein
MQGKSLPYFICSVLSIEDIAEEHVWKHKPNKPSQDKQYSKKDGFEFSK